MPEELPISPITAEKPVLTNGEHLRALNRKDIFNLSRYLAGRLLAAGEATRKTTDQDRTEANYLRQRVKTKNGRLDLKDHSSVPVTDPDKLWLALNILYPKKEAETAYHIIRTAQITTLGGRVTVGWDSRRIHEELTKNPKILSQFNGNQILFGGKASLRLLDKELTLLRSEKTTKGQGRRRLLKVAAIGGLALGAKIISDMLPAQASETAVVAKPSGVKPTEMPKTVIAAPTPESTPKPPDNLFNELIKPFIQEAMEKRRKWAETDPEYHHIIDEQLNENRLNVVVFGYGEEHGESYEDYGGAPSILSLDLRTGKVAVIHFSRDIRAPDLERLLPERQRRPMVIRSVYKLGGGGEEGFRQMRNLIGRMTGLVADYQLVMRDVVLRDIIAQLADGKLDLDIPKDHDTGPFRMDRVQYDEGFIKKGRQTMYTMQLMRYALAEDKNPKGRIDERSYRKNQVTESLVQKIRGKFREKSLFEKVAYLNQIKDLIETELTNKNLELGFDPKLIQRAFDGIFAVAGKFLGNLGQNIELTVPEIDRDKQLVFHDPFFGDGGVTRVHNIFNHPNSDGRVDHSRILEEVRAKKLPDWMLIPDGGNPYSNDLVRDYWQSTRKRVRRGLAVT